VRRALAEDYPGTDQHQAVLRAVVHAYAGDSRVRAVAVFGSLGRGDWWPDSDLDLDIVIADDTTVEVDAELRRLGASFGPLGERAALFIPSGVDSGDVVLDSLLQLSLRYHPLADTNPSILSGLRVLAGPLDQAELAAAARANRRPAAGPVMGRPVDRCLDEAITAERFLRRGELWLAVELLHQMRGCVIELFRRAQGGVRPIRTFDAQASATLKTLLGTTLPRYEAASIRTALGRVLDILEQHLEAVAGQGTRLTTEQQSVLARLRARMAEA